MISTSPRGEGLISSLSGMEKGDLGRKLSDSSSSSSRGLVMQSNERDKFLRTLEDLGRVLRTGEGFGGEGSVTARELRVVLMVATGERPSGGEADVYLKRLS